MFSKKAEIPLRMKFFKFVCIFIIIKSDFTKGNTHWMVTESGLIQPKVDSPFELARPYDLLAFLNQEKNWNDVKHIYNDLSKRQLVIDELWNDVDKNTDIGSQVLSDTLCLNAGQIKHINWHVSSIEDGSSRHIPESEYQLVSTFYGEDREEPDCKKISSLTFSMSTFEHLEAMINRENLTISQDLYLPDIVSPVMNVDQFANWLSGVLRKNSSSWLHYNLASLYWRVRGNAPKALECSRRAVHYAPREYKDIALFTLGTILHLAKMTEDAIIVLHAAVDHNPKFHLSHFQLGNAYAVLQDFNSSSIHLNECMRLQHNFEAGIKHRHAAVCLSRIWDKLLIVRQALPKLRTEVQLYSEKEAQLLKAQNSFLKAVKHGNEHDFRNVAKNLEKMSEFTGLDIKGLKTKGDKNSLIQHFLDGPMYTELWSDNLPVHAIEFGYSVQRLVRHIEKNVKLASDFFVYADMLQSAEETIYKGYTLTSRAEMLKSKSRSNQRNLDGKNVVQKPNKEVEQDMVEFENGPLLYPSTMKISRSTEEFDKDPDWPSDEFCKLTAPYFPENVEAIYPVFMDFENKGIHLGSLLTGRLGVPASVEYELPWHPPTCPQDKMAANLTMKKSQKSQLGEIVRTEYLKKKLFEYVSNGNLASIQHMQEAEIGHRIYAATKKKLAPKWLLYTLASLYWRVRGNNANALHCLYTANKIVPLRHKDLVLTSLASVCLEMGHFDEALMAAEEAFRIGVYEPATNFVLAEINMIKKHRNTHMFHLKQVVRADKEFYGGLARNLLNGWACIMKQVNALAEMDFQVRRFCTQIEPGTNMVCERDGSNCHVTSDKCVNSIEKADSSTIVRLLELKDESIHKSQIHNMDESVFDQFVENMPDDRGNLFDHQINFNNLMLTIKKKLKGCGPRGCRNLQAEDLALKEEDCSYHQLQLGYWLNIVSFKQPFSENNFRIPAEILSMIPSSKKVPECRVLGETSKDFFLERVVRVDISGWENILTLMHQFAEMFNFFDYVTLGAKIAKYVETGNVDKHADGSPDVGRSRCSYKHAISKGKPRSWLGALGAGWWCGAAGRGACAVRCLSAAFSMAPPEHAHHVLRALVALLHTHKKPLDAKDVAYLSFYLAPKSKIEAFLVAVSHTCLAEYEQAVWMYRYALSFDEKFLPAKACLHATMCLLFYGETKAPEMDE